MPSLDLSGLDTGATEVAGPFFEDLLESLGDQIVSLAVVGIAVTPDFKRGESEINSVAILKDLQTSHLHRIAPLGKKHGRKGVAAPFLLTQAAMESSRDVFALEFLNFRLAHKTVHGPDLLADLEVEREHLRLQVERELKAFLIQMRQGFIRSAGDPRLLGEVLQGASEEIFPELRGLLHLLGKPVALSRKKDLSEACEALEIDGDAVTGILLGDGKPGKSALDEVESRFSSLYDFVSALSEKVDAGLG